MFATPAVAETNTLPSPFPSPASSTSVDTHMKSEVSHSKAPPSAKSTQSAQCLNAGRFFVNSIVSLHLLAMEAVFCPTAPAPPRHPCLHLHFDRSDSKQETILIFLANISWWFTSDD